MKEFLLSGIPELFLLSIGFMLGEGGRIVSILAAALIHELGHAAAAALLGVKLLFCRTGVSGISLKYDFSTVSPVREALVCLAGPVSGIVTALLCYTFANHSYFAGASAALAALNLLPISYLDGGCALSAVLSSVISPNTAWHICRTLSVVCTLALWCASIYILLRIGGDISVMAAALYLLYRLFSEE